MNRESCSGNEALELFWEEGYSNRAISTMGGPSIEVYEMSFLTKPGGKVIDLGCGEGRNALFFAKRGCEVTAVDISSSGIEKVHIAAESLGVKVKGIVCDLNDLKMDDDYDVVLAHSSLHFLTREKWRSLLGEYKERTKPGGLHALTVLIPTERYPFKGGLLTNGHKQSFAIGELKEFYSDWEIIRYDAYLKEDKHPGIPVHSHYTEKIVCRKNPDQDKRGTDYTYQSLYSGQHDLPMDVFNRVNIGDDKKTVYDICGEPKLVNEVDFGESMGAKDILESKYVLKDLFYGKTAFQLINGEVRGKYIYDTEPVKVRFDHE